MTPWSLPRRLAALALLALDALALALLAAYAGWAALPHFCGDVTAALRQAAPSRRYEDRHGTLLLLEPTRPDELRQDAPLAHIAPVAQCAMMAAEDNDFRRHDGVNRQAALRAMAQNLLHARIISGASTITMQLVGLVLGRERSLRRKLEQAGCARSLEFRHGKDWILQNYLNRVPFGGRIHGIETAAIYYFGHSADSLSLAEASLLCGLPQRPSAYRLDRHPQQARERQRIVLHLMANAGLLTPQVAERAWATTPPLRDFRLPSRLHGILHGGDHYLQLAAHQADHDATRVVCARDDLIQKLLETALRRQADSLPAVQDAAGIILDNDSGEVLALCGTLDFQSRDAGQVNVVTSFRSAGSTLKPFIFAEAIDGGLICPDTILHDIPLRFGNYAPGNYDGTYQGGVRAAEALARSLNTPAVRLVARLGVRRLLRRLRDFGLLAPATRQESDELAERLGLSMTLGTAGHRLLDLAAAYAMLARGGLAVTPTFLALQPAADDDPAAPPPEATLPRVASTPPITSSGEASAAAPRRLLTPGAAALVSEMLQARPLPGCSFPVAWKTGTSSGNRDAWCFAYTRDLTVGIWLGNKDGSGSPSLVGATAAAPCAAAVLEALYRDRRPLPFSADPFVSPIPLCRVTGLRAVEGVCQTIPGRMATDIPLRRCQRCGRDGQRPQRAVRILRPLPETYVSARGAAVRLAVSAQPANVHWYLDDLYCGQLPQNARLDFPVGTHTLRAVSEDEDVRPATVTLTVRRRNQP